MEYRGDAAKQFSLKILVDNESPDFIFLNECLLFKFEELDATDLFRGEYCHELNSDDIHDPDLPFLKNKANGGTMILWKHSLDNFVTILPSETSSFLGLLFHPPYSPPSLHISLYLPTSGREAEFIEEITKLADFIDTVLDKHPGALLFIRGDSNVNSNNITRLSTFSEFQAIFNLVNIPLNHKTYHHFIGDGLFDSDIDVIMHSKAEDLREEVKTIYCQDDYACINSHHDLIVSTFVLPIVFSAASPPTSIVPSIPNNRIRIKWLTEAIPTYQSLLGQSLTGLRERWYETSSRSCVSLLLQVTSDILRSASSSSNTSISLSEKFTNKSKKVPRCIKKAMNLAARRLNSFKKIVSYRPRLQCCNAESTRRKDKSTQSSKDSQWSSILFRG